MDGERWVVHGGPYSQFTEADKRTFRLITPFSGPTAKLRRTFLPIRRLTFGLPLNFSDFRHIGHFPPQSSLNSALNGHLSLIVQLRAMPRSRSRWPLGGGAKPAPEHDAHTPHASMKDS